MHLRSTPRRGKDSSGVQVTENAYGHTRPNRRRELARIHVGTFTGPADTFHRHTEITGAQRHTHHALTIDAPPRTNQLTPITES